MWKDCYKMKLGEKRYERNGLFFKELVRVPGGWIYTHGYEGSHDNAGSTSCVFVPFNNEFNNSINTQTNTPCIP